LVSKKTKNKKEVLEMVEYLTKSRQGQFLVVGVLFTILGFIFIPLNDAYYFIFQFSF